MAASPWVSETLKQIKVTEITLENSGQQDDDEWTLISSNAKETQNYCSLAWVLFSLSPPATLIYFPSSFSFLSVYRNHQLYIPNPPNLAIASYQPLTMLFNDPRQGKMRPQMHHFPVPMNETPNVIIENPWTTGLFGCFEDIHSCKEQLSQTTKKWLDLGLYWINSTVCFLSFKC